MNNVYSFRRKINFTVLYLLTGAQILLGQTTGYSGTGSNIDITYYRCEWRINPDSSAKGIKGSVTAYFIVKSASITAINLDLNNSSFNNASLSVYYHGSPVSFSFPSTGNVNVLNMVLPAALLLNAFDSVTINYNGVPPAVSGQAEGYQKKSSAGSNYIYTLSESYEDRDWWPCKADMQDKADSMDIYINVPNSFTAVSQGRLIDSSVAGANQVFHWKSNIPVATYLVSVAVAKYRVYDRGTVLVNGTNVPVWYFIFPGKTAGTYSNILTALDNSITELSAFSTLFGDYPFKSEKHGFYEFGWGGGMEHQSISGMGAASMLSWSTIAHELAHQWFGDKVTFGTWNHLWLAEGFACYAEALAAEMVPALGQNPVTVRSGFKSTSNNVTYRGYGCYIPNASITSSDVLWSSAYGTTVYKRGAMVVSMLRALLGDAKFYQACQSYLNDPVLAYRSATTDDLRIHMQNAAGGLDLSPFFDSYVYGNGYPSYNAGIGWAKSGINRITLQVTAQTKSTGSTVAYYYTPVAIRVQGSLAGQDTVIIIYDQNGQLSRAGNGIEAPVTGNIISFNLNFNPVTVTFDPFDQTLANGSTNLNSLLDIEITQFDIQSLPAENRLIIGITSGEKELGRLILQKSPDGISFSDMAELKNNPDQTTDLQFHYHDAQPLFPYTFYRLKIITVNGVKYSKVLMAVAGQHSGSEAYPNPADNTVLIRWNGMPGAMAEISMMGLDGQILKQFTTNTNSRSIAVGEMPAGVYIVIVKQAGKIILRQKLLVRR